MQNPVEPNVSYAGRVLRIAVVWLAWIYAGVVAFDIPRLLNEKTDLIGALADATQEAKIYAGIWILGSIFLCALLITTLRQAFAARKVSNPHQ